MSRTQPNLPRTRTISQAIRDWRFSQGNYPPTQQTQAGSSSAWSQELSPGDFQEVLSALTEVTNLHDSANSLSEIQINILVQIRDAIIGLVHQLSENKKPKSLVLRTERAMTGSKKRGQKTVAKQIRCNTSNLRPLAVKVRILEIIFHMIITKTYATKRDIFYKHKQLFGTQGVVDRAITDICAFLNADRSQLNILSASRGSLIGPMIIETQDGEVDCKLTPISIVQNFIDLNMTFEGDTVLIVEKDTVFQRLIEDGFRRHFPNILLVTGRGFPDFVTRQFLKKIETKFKVPIYALVDCDPHGLHILLTYKYGSIKANSQIEGGHSASTISSLQQIGLRPSHTRQYHNRFQEIAFTRTDHTTINLVIRRAREVGDQSILHEANVLADSKVKVELEALVAYSPQFLITYLRDCQQQMPWILHHDSIAKSTPFARKSGPGFIFEEDD
uniref:Spo11/DNA topoisomerase VI subunit A N-terminal domain-containing protein n=1 Tax=Panagrolaimus sp. PS1159 TaxID=55785 RepID=A0AC35EVP6_9BILA